MLDQLRSDITSRLEELLGEADKLRRALTALDPRRAGTTSTDTQHRTNASSRSTTTRRRAAPSPAKTGSSPTHSSRATKTSPRTAPGATKRAVLAALAGGEAMTAGEVAKTTGLGQATVSTTLSRLAKTGEVAKAKRGYQVTKPTN